MTVAKIAIYGFDRLGRAVFQIASRRKDMKVVAIVSRDDARKNAELLSKDAIYDALSREIDYDGDRLVVDGQQVPVLTENVTTLASLPPWTSVWLRSTTAEKLSPTA